jgi:hypothetical protein
MVMVKQSFKRGDVVMSVNTDQKILERRVNIGIALIERGMLGGLGAFMINKLWHRLDPQDFWITMIFSLFVKRTHAALAIYVSYHGIEQLREYYPLKSSSIRPAVFGVAHILCSPLFVYSYYLHLKEKATEEIFEYELPPVVSQEVYKTHDYMVNRLVHLITILRSKSLNKG